MDTVWRTDNILHLIELYCLNTSLWNPSDKDFKNKPMRNAAMNAISTELNIPIKDIEAKIHTLRSQFSREKRKICSSGSAAGDTEKTKWPFYEPMQFLLCATGTSSSGSDTTKTVKETSESPVEMEVPSTRQHNSLQTQTGTKRKRDDLDDVMDILKSAKKKMNEPKDEFDIYGQYVASELRSVRNESAVIQAKSLINNILITMRMGNYGNIPEYQNASTSKQNLHPRAFTFVNVPTPPGVQDDDDSMMDNSFTDD